MRRYNIYKPARIDNGRLARWGLILQDFNIDVKYMKGSQMQHVDALSRYVSLLEEQLVPEVAAEFLPGLTEAEVIQEQAKDEWCTVMSSKPTFHTLESGLVTKIIKGKSKVVVPRSLKRKVLELYHDSDMTGHLGIDQTYKRISKIFYWQNIFADVRNYVSSCKLCLQVRKNKSLTPIGQPTEPSKAFEGISIDFVGPLETEWDETLAHPCKYILTIACQFTRFMEIFPTPDTSAKTVARILIREIFTRYGTPTWITSDQGTSFTNKLLSEICSLLQIKQIFTTPYNPQANGLLERRHSIMTHILTSITNQRQITWIQALPLARAALNSMTSRSTSFTPYEMVFGTDFNFPWSFPKELKTTSHSDYVKNLKSVLQKISKVAHENNIKAKSSYNQRRNKRAQNLVFEANDWVMLKKERFEAGSSKLKQKFEGPFKVIKQLSPQNLVILIGDEEKVVHISKVKRIPDRRDYLQG